MIKKNEKNQTTQKVENLVYNIIMFTLIFALVISFVFTIDKLILDRPINDCYLKTAAAAYKDYGYNPESTNLDLNCNYSEDFISDCYTTEGQIIYKKNCEIECNYCYKEYSLILDKYNNKINLGRMIFTFLLALAFAFILIKDKIIRYAILSAALVSLFIATISAISFLDKILPFVIILEFLLVIFIYKKTNKE